MEYKIFGKNTYISVKVILGGNETHLYFRTMKIILSNINLVGKYFSLE